ncbi:MULTISPECIES: hypothetical protein [unclassified Sphingomonas]|jgi:hypothetical protein|nr:MULTISPECIES: hypothetical protein [unclassified Sphingomonas]MCE3543951.1 hypothetical protein [Escherichia coli]MDA4833427.1 hypothetical protein [Enterobacter hormaechei]
MPLLFTINAYLARTRMPPATFGRRAINDPRLVHDLRQGRALRAATLARVLAFMREDGA